MNINLGDVIKSLRKEKNITQEEFAEVIGVSGQSVSRWELGVCYPDIEFLPIIANFFGVTVDRLLSNDQLSKDADRKLFLEKRQELEWGSEEMVALARNYCRKYPEEVFFTWCLVNYLTNYLNRNEDIKRNKYLEELEKAVEKLMNTIYRNAAIENMIMVCEEKDLDKWLNLCPYSSDFNRRGCLVLRAKTSEDNHIQQGLECIEKFSLQLDRRFPDTFGPQRKAAYQTEVLTVISSFGKNGEIPNGWKLFYAYKQLVLSACLFGMGKHDEGWREFDEAIEKYKYIFSLDDIYLDLGNELFANLKISKDWSHAIDTNGQRHDLFCIQNLSFYDAEFLKDFLEDPRWAWFNSVRDTKKYKAALEWAKKQIEITKQTAL